MKTSTSARSPLSPTLWPPDAFLWWRSLALLFILLFASLVPATLVLALAVAFRLATLTELRDPRSLSPVALVGQLVSYAVSLAIVAGVIPSLARRSIPALGLRAPRWSDLAWGLGGAAVMIVATAATGAAQQALFHLAPDEVQVQWLRAARGPMIAAFVVFAAVAAPFFEEIVFRGFVFNALLRYLPAWAAAVGSAALFGLAHMQPGNAGAIVPLAAGGVVLAAVYYRTGSLPAAMITHGAFNLFTVVLIVVFHQS